MKATGIVRRIDELGRVVIPKEIRRTLRIREGDPLEIFTDREGEIILKKYSPIGEMGDFARGFAEAISKTLGHTTLICDRDSFIAAAGNGKKDYIEKPVSREIENLMEQRQPYVASRRSANIPKPILNTEDDGSSYSAQIIVPVISEGEATGAVVIITKQEEVQFGDIELKVAQTAAGFLGKQMEQ